MKKIVKIVNIIILVITINALAEDIPDQIGVFGSYNLYQHSAKFGTLPNVLSCCPEYGDGTGKGFSAGMFYRSSINDFLLWQIRSGYSSDNGEFTFDEYIGNALDQNFNTTEAISEHFLKTSLGLIEVTPMISIKPIKLPLYINFGIPVGFNIYSSYDQSETLKQPSQANFLNGSKTRNVLSGKIEELTNPVLGGLISANIEFTFDKLSISPEISYYLGFSKIIKSREWKINSFRAGLMLAYNFTKEAYIPPPPQPKSTILASLDAVGINKDEKEEEILKFVVEEFLSRQLYPLIPYVFFDENSEAIPARYTYLLPDDIRNFDEHKKYFNSDVMTVYYDMLNIIGKRLVDNPEATITITGYNSNQRLEKGNIKLSQRRAEQVRNYLKDRWGIAESRMPMKWDNLPAKPTAGSDRDHFYENQRVEIYSDNYEIIKPVFVYDTLRVTYPPKLKVVSELTSQAPVVKWDLTASQEDFSGSKTLFNKSGFSYTNQDKKIIWDFKTDKKTIPRTDAPVVISLSAQNENDVKVEARHEIPVEQLTIQKKRIQRIDDKEIDEYRLIMFDFDTPEVLTIQKKILGIICENVKPESKIYIEGFTDRLGSDDYNLNLSEERAKAVKSSIPCNPASTEIAGRGEQLLYNNDVPEGRFYNRTVIIRVETPVKN